MNDCEWCGTPTKNPRMCSRACIGSYTVSLPHTKIGSRELKLERVEAVCLQCEAALIVTKKKAQGNVFCSRSCSTRYYNFRRLPRLPPCEVCGGRRKKASTRFCSSTCYLVNRRGKIDRSIEQGQVSDRLTLRKYLLRKRGHKCGICEIKEWRGASTPLILDHLDGDPSNDKPENIRLICPNCDAQLPTYMGRNRGKGRKSRGMMTYQRVRA